MSFNSILRCLHTKDSVVCGYSRKVEVWLVLLIQTLESSSCGKVQGALPEKWTRLQKGLEKAEFWLKVLLIHNPFCKNWNGL